ncbi:MAG: response regulator [Blautia sp.]|nr:response regulator [Blautia sp.]
MRNSIGRILSPDIPLKQRLFQLLSAIALAEFIIVTIYTVLSGGNREHIVIMLSGTAMFTATVAFTSRSEKKRFGATVSGLLYFSLYPITYFASGGMYGGAPSVFAFALVYVFLVTEKWERVVSLSLCILVSGICFSTAYLHPELLDRHTVKAEHIESFLSVCLVTLLLCSLFAFVTEVYRAENRIVQKQKKEILELNLSQKRFFSSMSHEIRTPVNAIIGLNEMNLRETLAEEVRENSLNIEVASKILLQTINEIMDMSKLETGRMEIVAADYQTTAMLSDIVNMTWLRAQEKGLDFRVEADPSLPMVLHGDEVRIRQILLNVITNAIKYTKKGSVVLSLGCKKAEEGIALMTYDVKDTGIGIRQENIPFLFDAFNRVDASQTHTIEGTGLGLSIVRQLLDMMEGSVHVESVYGKGTTFHIEIPQKIVDRTMIGKVDLKRDVKNALEKPESSRKMSALQILAVDDTPMNLMVVKKLLKSTDARIDTAESGAEALKMTAQNRYDVILMDHQMPEMDGIECLHRIREQTDGLCHNSKIVCLTANVGAELEKQYLLEGFDGYLEKPVRGNTLEKELARLCLSPQLEAGASCGPE